MVAYDLSTHFLSSSIFVHLADICGVQTLIKLIFGRNVMKTFVIITAAAALSAGVAFAEDTNPKGAGGAAVSATAQAVKEAGTNFGQWKKDVGYGGKNAPLGNLGSDVSNINAISNQ